MTAKSDRARELLNDPLLQEAFANVRAKLLTAFEDCDSNDSETMQDISKRLNLLKAVEQDLWRMLDDGTLEDFRAQEKEQYNG